MGTPETKLIVQLDDSNSSSEEEEPTNISKPKLKVQLDDSDSDSDSDDESDLFAGSDHERPSQPSRDSSGTTATTTTTNTTTKIIDPNKFNKKHPAELPASSPSPPAPAPAPSAKKATKKRNRTPAPQEKSKSNGSTDEEEGKTVEVSSTVTKATDTLTKKTSFYCSMCWGEDTEDELLFQCSECNVVYHNECYRGVSTDSPELEGLQFEQNENGLFVDTCLACRAVETTVRGRTENGHHEEITIKTRPYECCLCSVDDPNLPLPMHPIYDRNNGRQLILERWRGAPPEIPKYRLAWCHTLCALVIGTYQHTAGVVYSCNVDGYYGGHEADDDDRSVSSEIVEVRKIDKTKKPPKGADPIRTLSLYGHHHFCIVMMKQYRAYINAIKKAQKFECQICNQDDTKAKIWRIAIPCMCKEPQEPREFKACHEADSHECLIATHVGCAMWGKRINGKQKFPPLRRVYYKQNYDYDDLCVVYCNNHAKNIRDNGSKRGIEGHDWIRFPGNSGAAAIAQIRSPVPKDSETHITNTKDTIDSDREDGGDDDDAGFDTESDDEEDIGVVDSDDDTNDNGVVGKVRDNRQSNKTKKVKFRSSGKKRTNRAKRPPPKMETSRDRLEKAVAKRSKSSSSGHRTSSSSGRNSATMTMSFNQSASASAAPRKGLPTTLELLGEEALAYKKTDEPKKAPPPKKTFKSALKMRDLINGSANWGSR